MALPHDRLNELVELQRCGDAQPNELLSRIRRERDIGKWRPETDARIDPRDGMPMVYSMARALRPHDARPAEEGEERPRGGLVTSDADTCPVCQGQTTGVLDVAKAGKGLCFINKNLFPIVYPHGRGAAPEVHGPGVAACEPRLAVGGHYLQWTSDRHDLDLHNATEAHVAAVFEQLARFEGALLRSNTRMPRVSTTSGEALHGYVGIIKNRGPAVGGSLVHGHQQIVHTNVRPLRTQQHMAFLEREGRGVARFLLDDTPPELRVADLGLATVLTPYFLRRALQLMVVAHDTDKSYLHQLSKRELRALARGVRLACAAATELMPRLGREVAYNLVVHNGPIGGLYVELLPWTQQYGGYEQLGLFVVQGTPEHSHRLVTEWLEQRG